MNTKKLKDEKKNNNIPPPIGDMTECFLHGNSDSMSNKE